MTQDLYVEVRLFAAARQLAGAETVRIALAPGGTVEELRARIAAAYPDLAPLLPHVLFAINSQYVGDEHVLSADEEIACIPPVSGG